MLDLLVFLLVLGCGACTSVSSAAVVVTSVTGRVAPHPCFIEW